MQIPVLLKGRYETSYTATLDCKYPEFDDQIGGQASFKFIFQFLLRFMLQQLHKPL